MARNISEASDCPFKNVISELPELTMRVRSSRKMLKLEVRDSREEECSEDRIEEEEKKKEEEEEEEEEGRLRAQNIMRMGLRGYLEVGECSRDDTADKSQMRLCEACPSSRTARSQLTHAQQGEDVS